MAGDLSLGSAELVTFLAVIQKEKKKRKKNRTKSSLKEKQLILLPWLKDGTGPSEWGRQEGRSTSWSMALISPQLGSRNELGPEGLS